MTDKAEALIERVILKARDLEFTSARRAGGLESKRTELDQARNELLAYITDLAENAIMYRALYERAKAPPKSKKRLS